MIVNIPIHLSDVTRNFLRNREIGQRPIIGTSSRLHAKLYSAVKCVNEWNPVKTVNETHHGGIFNFDFSPDGSLLVAACERKSILMFDPLNARLIKVKNQAHNDCVNCVRFLDSRTFATCSDDTTVRLWDARFLKSQVRTFRGHSNWVKNIEYAQNQGLLVTSGFDGSIYSWAINSYSDSDVSYTSLFYTSGLMRSKLTPDASKLVIATAGGYLMVVHNLDLEMLSEDLSGFKPNYYRLMQNSGAVNRQAHSFNHVFTQKRNRVEFISDFHTEDDAEMITSLEIHPQGWCAVSRNTSKEDRSEWTSIHDIQDYGIYKTRPSGPPNGENKDDERTEIDEPQDEPPGPGGDAERIGNGDIGNHVIGNTSSDSDSDLPREGEESESSDEEAISSLAEFDLSSTLRNALEHVRSQFPDYDLTLNLQPSANSEDNEAVGGNVTQAPPQAGSDGSPTLSSLVSGDALGSLLASEGSSSRTSRPRRVEFRFGLSLRRSAPRVSEPNPSPETTNDSPQTANHDIVPSMSSNNLQLPSPITHSGPTSSVTDPRVPPRVPASSNDSSQNASAGPTSSHMNRLRDDSIALANEASASNASQPAVRIGDAVTLTIRSGNHTSERTLLMMAPIGNKAYDPNVQIHQNRPRLTHYVPEPNVGRGFIKEVCFSHDGRLICSPFGYGIRLLAFDPLCNELCDCLPDEPTRLFEVCDSMNHEIEVVTTKFSPTHPLIVSGCLNGKVNFYQPRF